MDRKGHWESVYTTRNSEETSWFQQRPDVSLSLIAASGVEKDAGIIDAGGGDSPLVGYLLDSGYGGIGVLDLSEAALARSRARLGERANLVEWFEADVTTFEPPHRFGLWHDRAVFHFLTSEQDRRKYVATLDRTLAPEGHLILATFAPDGPEKCSGLEIVRYDERGLAKEMGAGFVLLDVRHESHQTPWKSEQRFIYTLFRRA